MTIFWRYKIVLLQFAIYSHNNRANGKQVRKWKTLKTILNISLLKQEFELGKKCDQINCFCNLSSTYSYTLPSVSLLVERTWEYIMFEPQYEIDAGLGTGYDVEWSRQSSAVLKVTHPQLGTRKLPLLICLALKPKKNQIL